MARPRLRSAATTAPVVTVRFFAYSVYAVASRTTPSTKLFSTPRTSSYSSPLMRFTPARRARRRIEPLVTLRTLSFSTFFTRFALRPLLSPDFFPFAMLLGKCGKRTTRGTTTQHTYRRFSRAVIRAHNAVTHCLFLRHALRTASLVWPRLPSALEREERGYGAPP